LDARPRRVRLGLEELETRLAPAGNVTATLAVNPQTANLGDTLSYTAVITNSSGSTATGVQYSDTLDANTTLVNGSLHASPIASNDTYNWIGNTTLDSAAAGLPGLFANDTAPVGEAIHLVSNTNPADGSVVINADGSFVYTPNANTTHATSDSFSYTINNTAIPGATSTATVTINFAGSVWYVNSAAAAGGSGTIASPFQTLAAASSAAAAGDSIFLYGANTYTGPITLTANEQLIGQGTDLTFDTGSKIVTLVAAGTGNTPTINNTVTLASGDTLEGFNISSGANAGLAGSGGLSGITTSKVGVTTTTGTAVSLNNVGGTFSFHDVSANGPVNGISLTNTTGSFTVTGNGTNDASGGFIQNTTGNGILLNNAQNISLTSMKIQHTVGSGIKGSNNVVNFSFINGTIDDSKTSALDGTNTTDQSNIAFNNNQGGTEKNITGTITITGSTLTNAYYHGIDIFNYDGTLSDVEISNNTITSGTTTGTGGTSFGTGIRLTAFGSATTVASVTQATISNNVIQNFPGGDGILAQGGNSNTAGPTGTFGTANDQTRVIAITGNTIQGNSTTNRIGAKAIAANTTRGTGNFVISNNGTSANPITNVTGNVISNSAFGSATVTSVISNNYIVANHTAGGGGALGISVGVDSINSTVAVDSPNLTVVIDGNHVSQTDANGILATARDSNATVNYTITNNVVAAPLGGVRPGIRVDSQSSSTAAGNTTVYLAISGNTSAGSGGTNGIGLRKQGTSTTVNVFGIQGLTPSPAGTPDVETYVNGQNPAGNGTLLISATSGFVAHSVTAAGTLTLGSLPNTAQVGAAYSQSITASGGNGTYTFRLVSGSLPPGLTLSSGGTVSGTATAGGSFSFTVGATDTSNPTASGTQAYTLNVASPTINFNPASLSAGTVGAAYSQTVSASGSTTSFHFTISAGSLPAGLFLN
jgi:hypothetical protein